jgi:hypothetical protein
MLLWIPVSHVRLFQHLITNQHFRRHVPHQTSDILSITKHRHQPQAQFHGFRSILALAGGWSVSRVTRLQPSSKE